MSWSERTVRVEMQSLISVKEKTVSVRLDQGRRFGAWLIEVGGVRWKLCLKYESPMNSIDEESEWRICGPGFFLTRYGSRGSHMLEFDAELHYTIDIGTGEPYKIQQVVYKEKLDWETTWNVDQIISLEHIKEICKVTSFDELGDRKYKNSTTVQVKIKMRTNSSKTNLTPTLSLLEETEGFSDIEFELENEEKLYGNKEILSECSKFFEKHFNEDPNCSIMKLENIALEDFHGFLKMIFPNCDQDFDENRILAIMQLGVTYQAQCVMRGCEDFLINSEENYSEEDLEQFFELAEDHNLNQLQTWCFETMNEKQNAIQRARRAEMSERRKEFCERKRMLLE